jgi:hypothetical protein
MELNRLVQLHNLSRVLATAVNFSSSFALPKSTINSSDDSSTAL